MSKRLTIPQVLVILTALGLAGCGAENDGDKPPAAVTAAAPGVPAGEVAQTRPAPSWQEAANASYVDVFGEDTVMTDGLWEGEPYVAGGAAAPRAGLVDDFLLSGELDSDGAEESVVLVWSSSGGSGTFDHLAVLDRDPDGVVVNRATTPLGDRVKVRSAAIEDGRVVLELVQAGLDDAACCPGQKMRRTFVLEGEKMTEISTENLGRLSLADLDGEWKLLQFGRDEALPEEVEITLQFQDATIAGKAACNRYTGAVVAGEMPGTLSLSGPMALTRMLCPPPLMDWEQRYTAALEGLAQYTFVAGRLVLSWRSDGDAGTLTFVRVAGE